MRFSPMACGSSATRLSDHAAGYEDEQVDEYPPDHEEGYGDTGQHRGTARNLAHDARQGGVVDAVTRIRKTRLHQTRASREASQQSMTNRVPTRTKFLKARTGYQY